MEYIGLIGLIGLLGVLSGKGISNKFNKLRNDTSRNEENITDLETQVERQAELLIDYQKEIDRLNFVMKNYTTIGELSNFSRQIKREILQEIEKNFNPPTYSEEFSQVLEQRISVLESEIKNLSEQISTGAEVDLQINNNDELFAKFQKEIEQLKILIKNFATISDLNDFSRQLKRDISKEFEQTPKYKSKESVKNFEQRISALETDNKNLRDKITEQDATISQFEQVHSDDSAIILEQRISALETDNKNLRDKITEQDATISQVHSDDSAIILEQRISALESNKKILLDKIAKQEVLIIQYQTNFKDLQKTFDEQIIAYEDRLRQIETLSNAEKILPPFQAGKALTIKNFQLENIVGPLFTNNQSDMVNVFHTVENVWSILSFLENSKFERKESFIRVIKNYQNNLQKFTEKVRQGKFGTDSYSEKVTNAFFDTLSKYFLATLPISIYRGSQENLEFYSEFLLKINEYLTACHIYTELIEPKKLIKNDTLEKMQIVKKETQLKSEDEMIDEVERLPYFLDYFTDEDDEESFCFEGKLILLKFKGGKK